MNFPFLLNLFCGKTTDQEDVQRQLEMLAFISYNCWLETWNLDVFLNSELYWWSFLNAVASLALRTKRRLKYKWTVPLIWSIKTLFEIWTISYECFLMWSLNFTNCTRCLFLSSLWLTTNTELKNHAMVTSSAIHQLCFVQISRVLKFPLFPKMTQLVCARNRVHVFEVPVKVFSHIKITVLDKQDAKKKTILTSLNFSEGEVLKSLRSEQAPPQPGAEFSTAWSWAPHLESTFQCLLLLTSLCHHQLFSRT